MSEGANDPDWLGLFGTMTKHDALALGLRVQTSTIADAFLTYMFCTAKVLQVYDPKTI